MFQYISHSFKPACLQVQVLDFGKGSEPGTFLTLTSSCSWESSIKLAAKNHESTLIASQFDVNFNIKCSKNKCWAA